MKKLLTIVSLAIVVCVGNNAPTAFADHCPDLTGPHLPGAICPDQGGNEDTAVNSEVSFDFGNPLQQGSVEAVLATVLSTIQAIVAILATVFIVIGGIIYITSAGDQNRVTLAKTAITAAIIGFALALAAPSLLKEIYTIIGANDTAVNAIDGQNLSVILLNLLRALLGFVGILAIIMLVIGGIMYIASAGDDKRIDMSKNMIKYAITGLIIALLSLVIVTWIAGFFDAGGSGSTNDINDLNDSFVPVAFL